MIESQAVPPTRAIIAKRKAPTIAVVDALARLEDPEILRQAAGQSRGALLDPRPVGRGAGGDDRCRAAGAGGGAARVAGEPRRGHDDLGRSRRSARSLNGRFLFDAMAASPQQPVYGQKAQPLPEVTPVRHGRRADAATEHTRDSRTRSS